MVNERGLWLPKTAIDPIKKYRTTSGVEIQDDDFFACASYMDCELLPECYGKKVSMVVISVLKSLGAKYIRISHGEVTTDGVPYRATIIVDKDDLIQSVSMELPVTIPFASKANNGNELTRELKGEL